MHIIHPCHKVNHSFRPNCRFGDFLHPLHGRIRSVVTRQPLEAGAELFYNGSMGQQLVADLAEHGGIITTADMADYRFILPGSAAHYGV